LSPLCENTNLVTLLLFHTYRCHAFDFKYRRTFEIYYYYYYSAVSFFTDVSEKSELIWEKGSGSRRSSGRSSGQHAEPVAEAHFMQHLKQTREGGYMGKKGLNIETSPDSVRSRVVGW
jgi:hypothetical protein